VPGGATPLSPNPDDVDDVHGEDDDADKDKKQDPSPCRAEVDYLPP